MDKPLPKYRVGQVVVLKSIKKEYPFRILSIRWEEDGYYYQWNKNNFASESMLRGLDHLEEGRDRPLLGTWPEKDIRRAFVDGAKWWEFYSSGATMWASDQNIAEKEAERRYGEDHGDIQT